jgi:hypothetical protein
LCSSGRQIGGAANSRLKMLNKLPESIFGEA